MTVQCITCQYFSLRSAGRMASHGFGNCAKKPAYEFESASLQRQCPKHTEVEAEAAAKRRQWLGRLA